MKPSRNSLRIRSGRGARKRGGSRGFTLIELLITIVIAAILAVLAVPLFDSVMLGTKLNTVANNFVASTHLARSEAIKRNVSMTLCASSDSSTCTGAWKDGWVLLDQVNDEVILAQGALPKGFLLTEAGGVTSIGFLPTGVGTTAAVNMTLCRATPTVGSRARTITLSMAGRPEVVKVENASSCP